MIEQSLRPASVTHRFPRNRRSPGQARRAFRGWAAAQGLGPTAIEAGELVLGELASNAVLAATGPGRRIEIQFALTGGTLRIEVSDAGDGTPVVRSPGPLDGTAAAWWSWKRWPTHGVWPTAPVRVRPCGEC